MNIPYVIFVDSEIFGLSVLFKVKNTVSIQTVIDFSIIKRLEVTTLHCDISAAKPRSLRRFQLTYRGPIVVPVADIASGELLVVK